jgi:hypothetical protein
MLMLASRTIWSRATTQLDFSPVEVFLKLRPLAGSDRLILVHRPRFAATVEEFLVVAHDILVEHSDISASGLQIQGSE